MVVIGSVVKSINDHIYSRRYFYNDGTMCGR
jgi:hypothetical protein